MKYKKLCVTLLPYRIRREIRWKFYYVNFYWMKRTENRSKAQTKNSSSFNGEREGQLITQKLKHVFCFKVNEFFLIFSTNFIECSCVLSCYNSLNDPPHESASWMRFLTWNDLICSLYSERKGFEPQGESFVNKIQKWNNFYFLISDEPSLNQRKMKFSSMKKFCNSIANLMESNWIFFSRFLAIRRGSFFFQGEKCENNSFIIWGR